MAKKDLYQAMLERMKLAIEAEFYLEACWIQYAILEDRLNSVIRHTYPKTGKKFLMAYRGFDRKIDHIIKKIHPENVLCKKSINKPLLESIRKWKDRRNDLMHEISDSAEYDTVQDEAQKIALEGVRHVNMLGNKVRKYKEAIKKQATS